MKRFFIGLTVFLLMVSILGMANAVADERDVLLVVQTVTSTNEVMSGYSISDMVPLVDDLGVSHPIEAGGINTDRTYFSLQSISLDGKNGKIPSKVMFDYELFRESGYISYTLNQEKLGVVRVYQISVAKMKVSRVIIRCPIPGEESKYYEFEQGLYSDQRGIVVRAVAGLRGEIFFYNGQTLIDKISFDTTDVKPSFMDSISLFVTDKVETPTEPEEYEVVIGPMDEYDFAEGAEGRSWREHLEDAAEAAKPPVTQDPNAISYTVSPTLQLFSDEECTQLIDPLLDGEQIYVLPLALLDNFNVYDSHGDFCGYTTLDIVMALQDEKDSQQ